MPTWLTVSAAVSIEQQITRSHITGFYSLSHVGLGARIVRKSYAEVRID